MGARRRKAQRALLGRIPADADYTETLWTGEGPGRSDPRANQLVALHEVAAGADQASTLDPVVLRAEHVVVIGDTAIKLREVAYPSLFAAAARIVATSSRKTKNLRTKNPCSYAVPLARR
jgi:hypothetical protein